MRTLLLTLAAADTASLRTALATTLGTASIDACQAVEAAVTWLENRPCDLLAIAGPDAAVAEAVGRVRRVSRTLPILAIVADAATPDAGACWLAGADDVTTAAGLAASQYPEGLDDARHPERHALRRTQRLWYAGPSDALRQQFVARVGARFRDVGLTGEGLAGLTTQDVEDTQSAALVVNASQDPGAIVLGIRRVKRSYPELAITVVADGAHHDAFRRAGADQCVTPPADVDHLLHAVGRALGQCRASFELESVRSRETRLRALVEQLPEGIVLVSPEHTVLAANLAALRVLGAQDARQVLGASLGPWLDPDDAHSPDLVTFVDGVAGGSTREIVMRTRHLAEARRLLLRAVPFQRESGGPPAALIAVREMPNVDDTAAVAEAEARLEQARQAWEQERAALAAGVEALEAELARLRPVEEALRVTEGALADARAQAGEIPALRAIAARLEALGVDVEAIAGLLDASRRLATLEQEELPLLMARAEIVQQRQAGQDEEITSLRAEVARLTSAHAAAEPAIGSPAAAPAPSPIDAHRWLLEIAGLGLVRTTIEGTVLEADERAARLCGYEDAAAMRRAASMPAPLVAAAGDDADGPVRFEVDLQADPATPPHRIAGARMAGTDDQATRLWLLAEAPALPARAARHGQRQQAMSAVLEAAAAECRSVVEAAGPRLRGPRPVDETGESAHSTGSRALARAQAMLAQVSAIGRRRPGDAAALDLTAHLEAAQPLLARLATEDLVWQLQLPAAPIHACVTPAEFERCVTTMVTIGRDALPVGGQLTLWLEPEDSGTGALDVRRPVAAMTLETQGYGLVEPEVTTALHELAAALGATVDVARVDDVTARLTLRLPRAFVMTHVA